MPNLVGIGNSQVPTNAMLGGMAYQDPAHANLTSVEIENIAAITQKISKTLIDVIIYDTRKDSDGGAWRKRTKNTSWYNEPPSETRGHRKEFPAVAVIAVMSKEVIIYDGDDPNMSMWMVFTVGANGGAETVLRGGTARAVGAANATIVFGMEDCPVTINLINEQHILWHGAGMYQFTERQGIRDRNVVIDEPRAVNGNAWNCIASSDCWDVAIRVLPNAPIDHSTGLPKPTIALFTASGTSIIPDFGDYNNPAISGLTYVSTNRNHRHGHMSRLGRLRYGHRSYNAGDNFFMSSHSYNQILSDDSSASEREISYGNIGNGQMQFNPARGAYRPGIRDSVPIGEDEFMVATASGSGSAGDPSEYGVWKFIENERQNSSQYPEDMLSVGITTEANTGWMIGDTPFCWCADARGNASYSDATSTNLITNGTFDSNTTGWSSSGATLSQSSGKMRILTSSQGYAYQSITTVIGTQYVMTFDITSDGNASAWVLISSTTHGASNPDLINANPIGENQVGQTVGGNGFNFTATTTTTYLTIRVSTSGSNKDIYIDNVEVVAAERNDLGHKQSGLKAIGTVPKSPVATGADLLAYGPFSSSNLLLYPKNHSSYSDYNQLKWANYDFSISGWFNCSDVTPAADNDFFTFTDAGPTEAIFLQIRTDGRLRFYVKDSNYTINADTAQILRDDVWFHFVCVRRGREYLTYLNGELEARAETSGIINVSNANITVIGGRPQPGTGNYCTTTKVALIRPSMSVPSEDQIRRMYKDELKMFQKDAKCTLYGASHHITAIAYDEDTGIAHVGTPSGRSDLHDLVRINNTTTAVTTCMDASNGLIVEQ